MGENRSEGRKEFWEASYKRCENFIFYPKEEVVKFLNRFVRKRIGVEEFVDIIPFPCRALDFGCGIGAQTLLMREFGIEAYGVDISEEALKTAKGIANSRGVSQDIFLLIEPGQSLPFPDNYFDLTIAESVLDSMHFDMAQKYMKEIDRVTKKLVYLSLISGDDSEHYLEYNGEEIVQTAFEYGTIQSYFNYEKINRLIQGCNFRIQWCRKITEQGVNHRYRYSRYYVVLEKA